LPILMWLFFRLHYRWLLIGLEPSASFGAFRDEYLRLADDENAAIELAKKCFFTVEGIFQKMRSQRVETNSNQFSDEIKTIKFTAIVIKNRWVLLKLLLQCSDFPSR
jgi:hypothetical protein